MCSFGFQHTYTQQRNIGKQLGHLSSLPEVLQSLEHQENPQSIYPLLINAFGQISSLSSANKLHACVVFAGLDKHPSLSDHLMDLYSRCNSIQDAHIVFKSMTYKRITSWNTIIAACIKQGSDEEALSLFAKLLKRRDVEPNKVTLIRALVAASHDAALPHAMILHTLIVECKLESNLYVGNALISAYNRCGCLDDAKMVFQQMPTRDVVSWTTMIDVYAQLNNSKRALQLFRRMQSTGVKPNAVTFISLIKVFNSPAALTEGKEIHSLIQDSGFELEPILGNALISMYGKCGSLEEAHAMYNKMCPHDVVSWNCILAAYAQQGCGKDAMDLFEKGCKKGLNPNKVTYVSILDACAGCKALEKGRLIHTFISERNIHCDIVLETAILNMYGKCGSVEDAKHGFDTMATHNVVSWTAIISAFSQHGYILDALKAFYKMMMFSTARPNNVTYVAILDACTSLTVVTEGKLIHFAIVCGAFDSDSIVGNTLLNMYSNCGQIDDAVVLFNSLVTHDVIAWTAMIGAYAQHGHGNEALELFAKMLQSNAQPNNITFTCIFDTCAALSNLAEGKLIHAHVVEMELALDCDLGTALVSMYGKCGSVDEAYMIFLSLNSKDVVSWNVMLAAYAQHGHGKLALQLYRSMEGEGVRPNSFTFISVINACSHAGLVELGQQYLDSMKPKHRITPTSEHYTCMVDLLGRAGQLEEAEKFINRIPLPPSAAVWMSYLSACRLHGNLERGALAAENVRKLEPQNLSAYVVLSNIYAALGRWDDLAKMGDVKTTVG